MHFSDVIKKSVLSNFTNTNFSAKETILMLGIAALIGVFVFFVYRFIVREGFYSKAFSVSLIILSIITATIIITIQSSIVVSLGMVGALSIVRFRTAIKNPMDLVFSFWSISAGIVVGAGLPVLAVIMSLVIAIILVVFMSLFEGRKTRLIHVRGHFVTEEIVALVTDFDGKARLQSENYSKDNCDLLFVTRLKDATKLVSFLREKEGVTSVSSIEHTEGQY